MIPALYDLVAPILAPLPLIWADQNGPKPAKPYATITVRGGDEAPVVQGEPDAAGIATTREHRLMRAEVEIYGANAFAAAQTLGLKLRLPSNLRRSYELDLGVARVRQATNLTALLDESQQYEARALLEFTFHASEAATDDVGLIEHVVIEAPCEQVISSPTAATPPPEA